MIRVILSGAVFSRDVKKNENGNRKICERNRDPENK